MTQPNLPAIRQRLAEWLGWQNDGGHYLSHGMLPMDVDDWRPDARIEQAWLLLERFTTWGLDHDDDAYRCFLLSQGVAFRTCEKTAPLAITLAVYAAVGGGE